MVQLSVDEMFPEEIFRLIESGDQTSRLSDVLLF